MKTKMARWFLMLGAVAMAVMFWGVCAHADTYTTGDLVLTKPSKSSLNWDGKINGNFDVIAASAATKASTQTFTGQNTFSNKVGFFSSPNGAYGVYIATTTGVTGKMTTLVASDILDWTSSGFTSTFFGSHNGALSGDDGFGFYDKSNTWNGRLDLGLIYGPQLHGKGAIGAPLLGLNTSAPAYAFDITGGLRVTSTSTLTGDVYMGGKLGVNGQTPTYALDINGATRMTAQAIVLGSATISGQAAAASLLVNSMGTNPTTIYSTTSATALSLVLPPNAGTNGYVLGTDGAGNTRWQPESSAAGLTFMINGASPDISGYLSMISVDVFTPAARSTSTVASPVIVNQYISSAATNVGYPNLTFIPAGIWHDHVHAQATNASRIKLTLEIYLRTAAGVESDFCQSVESEFISTSETEYDFYCVGISTAIAADTRVVRKFKATTIAGATGISIYANGIGANATDARLEMPAVSVNSNNFVPYTGATKAVNLGANSLTMTGPLTLSGSSLTVTGTPTGQTDLIEVKRSSDGFVGGRIVASNGSSAHAGQSAEIGFKANSDFAGAYYSGRILSTTKLAGDDSDLAFYTWQSGAVPGGTEKMRIETGGVTVVGTATVQGNAFSVGGSTLVVSGGKVGIGITPVSLLHLDTDLRNTEVARIGNIDGAYDRGVTVWTADDPRPGNILTWRPSLDLSIGDTPGITYAGKMRWSLSATGATGKGSNTMKLSALSNLDSYATETDIATFQGNGNVGIGTTAPTTALSFGAGKVISVATTDGADNSFLQISGGGDSGANRGSGFTIIGNEGVLTDPYDAGSFVIDAGNVATGDIAFRTNANLERMKITYGGNVGIGDTAPTAKLVVNGNVVSSGTIYAQTGFYGSGASLSDVSNLVSSGTVLVATGTITIASLDGNADGAYHLIFISSTSTTGMKYRLNFNGDTTDTNYSNAITSNNGITVGAATENSARFLFSPIGMGTPLNTFADVRIYRGANGRIMATADGSFESIGTDIQSQNSRLVHASAQTNITSMSILCDNSQMLVGTRWELYRSR